MTRAGTAAGDYWSHDMPVNLIKIGQASYLKAVAAFWMNHGQPLTADRAAGAWAKVTADEETLGFDGLAPPALARTLEGAGNDPRATKTKVAGQSVIKMSKDGTTYYISRHKPRRLVRIDGIAGNDAYSFDVSPLAAGATGPLFAELRSDAAGLAGAYDQDAAAVVTGKVKPGSCDQDACAVTANIATLAPGDPAPPATILVKITITFSATRGGKAITTCTATSSATVGQTRAMSCRTAGGAWTSWYESHVGTFYIYARADLTASVNSAADVNDLMGQLGREQGA